MHEIATDRRVIGTISGVGGWGSHDSNRVDTAQGK
jgi:hypothetical protein